MSDLVRKLRWRGRRMLGLHIPPIITAVRKRRLTYLDEEALYDLHCLVSDIERAGRAGVLIEAGCALGGSAIVIAAAKSPARPFYVYDVFGLIPSPSERDGADAHERYAVIAAGGSKGINGARYYGYEEGLYEKVQSHFCELGLPTQEQGVSLVQGLFQDVLVIHEPVAMAHIDGDWYDSVMTCLERIEPHLVPGGVIVVDDYDHWSGCRKAVDEFFRDKADRYALVRRSRLHVVRRS
jgi:hypothetical protein